MGESIGVALSGARQQAGLSLAELSQRTKIREAVVAAMERDDFSISGGDFYARGHLRALAKELGLDGEELVRHYNEAHGGQSTPARVSELFKTEVPIKLRESRTPNWTLAMAAALGVTVIFGLVRIMGGPEAASMQAAAKKARAVPKAPAAAVPVTRPLAEARDMVTLRVVANKPAWVNVRDVKGKILFQGEMAAGDSETFQSRKRIRLMVDNGDAVQVMVNGQNLGAPGRSGQSVRRAYGPGVPRPR